MGSRAVARARKSSPRSDGQKSPDRPQPSGGTGGLSQASNLVDPDVTTSNRYIETELGRRLQAVEDCIDADVMVCIHPIIAPFDTLIRDHLDDIKNKRSSLLVILETEGGSIETTERIADLFRHSYRGEVSFLIPNFAMSAGTILVMSGDRIFMDYFSIIGPIDPQMVHPQTGGLVPALGYLEKYAELIQKSKRGGLSQAELAFLLDKFDPAQLHRLEQAREHSVDLLKRWLAKYKFKNWDRTRTRNRRVTTKMKTDRAAEVANKLNNTRLWRSHGRGLSIEVVRNDLDLIVEDFGTEPALKDLNVKVRSYYRLLQDYMEKRGQEYVIHTRDTLFAL